MSINYKIIAVTIVTLMMFGSANAVEMEQLIQIKGTCKKLIIAGKDISNQCQDEILQSYYSDGRNGFYVFSKSTKQKEAVKEGEGFVITFSGFDGKKPDVNSQIQNLDKIIINYFKTPEDRVVKGSCLYGNKYVGNTKIVCRATDNMKQEYFLEFEQDPGAPLVNILEDYPGDKS